MPKMIKLMGRFAFTGVVSTGFALISLPTIFSFNLWLFKAYYGASLTQIYDTIFNISYCIAVAMNVTFSFVLQKRAVFRTTIHWFYEYIRFWMGSLAILLLGYILFLLLMNKFNVGLFVANLIVVASSAVMSFIFHSAVTFRSGR